MIAASRPWCRSRPATAAGILHTRFISTRFPCTHAPGFAITARARCRCHPLHGRALDVARRAADRREPDRDRCSPRRRAAACSAHLRGEGLATCATRWHRSRSRCRSACRAAQVDGGARADGQPARRSPHRQVHRGLSRAAAGGRADRAGRAGSARGAGGPELPGAARVERIFTAARRISTATGPCDRALRRRARRSQQLLHGAPRRGRGAVVVAAAWLALEVVEIAYFESIAELACTDIAPPTPDFRGSQNYPRAGTAGGGCLRRLGLRSGRRTARRSS